MAEFKINKDERYKALNCEAFQNSDLSYKAKGILAYLLSRPKNWKGQIFDIEKNSCKDGKNSIKTGIKELVDKGYAKLKSRGKDENGKFLGMYYEFFDTSQYN